MESAKPKFQNGRYDQKRGKTRLNETLTETEAFKKSENNENKVFVHKW